MNGFNIQIVSQMTGLSIPLIRTWEKRYHVVNPKRNHSGHRMYSDEEVLKLKILNDLCILGNNISSLADKNVTELNELLKSLSANTRNTKMLPKIEYSKQQLESSLTNLMTALNIFRLDIISHEIYKLKITLPLKSFIFDIVSPLLGMIGQNVANGTLTISKEHALSSIIKFHLGDLLYRNYEGQQKADPHFIITTPEGELHEFGILLAAILCGCYNYQFIYLGPNMPVSGLLEAVKSIKAKEIILGVTSVGDSANYAEKLLKGLTKNQKLILGGPGLMDVAKFQKKSNFLYLPTLVHLDHYLKQSRSN